MEEESLDDESVDVGHDSAAAANSSSEVSVTATSPTNCNQQSKSTSVSVSPPTSKRKKNKAPTTPTKKKKNVKPNQEKKKTVVRRGKKEIEQEKATQNSGGGGLEASVEQVAERFAQGCECRGDGESSSCFSNINPESAYKHRLNIAELTRSEHDMYLMGVTMASLSNPDETARHTERKRLRTQYVFQGKKICLDAFLYLENCTQYQLKRIRKHIMTMGVTPRVHGNHGKRPHNRFSLDIYQQATAFLQTYIQRIRVPHSSSVSVSGGGSCYLPADVTCKTVHAAYKEYMEHFEPGTKWLGYSTFRQFLKRQFPLVKFTVQPPPVIPPPPVSATSLVNSPPVVTTDDE